MEACMGDEPVQVGQTVVVEGTLRQGLKAVWLAYAVPLNFMVAVLFLGCKIWSEEVGALFVLLFLILYYSTLYLFRDRINKRFQFHVRPLDDGAGTL